MRSNPVFLTFLTALAFLTLGRAFACEGPTDPKRVALMVDMNTSYRELESAKDAACRRGLRFISIPEESVSRRIGRLHEEALLACDAHSSSCEKLRALAKEAARPVSFDTQEALEALAARLRAEKAKIEVFVLSGHHSKGGFYGDDITRGSFEDEKFFALMNAHADIFGRVDLLALWGCGAVNANEAMKWRIGLPNLQVLAGYMGTAPRGIRAISSEYLGAVVLQAPKLVQAGSESSLAAELRNVRGVAETDASIYVHTLDGANYLYARGRVETLNEKLRCRTFLDTRLASEMLLIRKYFTGELSIPLDSPNSPLTIASLDLNENRACFNANVVADSVNFFTPDQAELLRFFETDVKPGFAQTYAPLLEKADAEWASLDESLLRPGLNRLEKNRVEDYFERLRAVKAQIPSGRFGTFLARANRAEIIRLVESLEGVVTDSESARPYLRALDGRLENLSRTIRTLRTSLVDLKSAP